MRVPARPEGPGSHRASLPFATLIPARVQDVAPEAVVTSRFGAPGSVVTALTDGVVDATRNFTLAQPSPVAGAEALPWLLLSWNQTQSVRGLAIFSGAEERGFEGVVIEGCVSTNAPRDVTDAASWQRPAVRLTEPGHFRGCRFAVVQHEMFVRGLRLRCTNALLPEISLGEILVLSLAPAGSGGRPSARLQPP
jgi:hypothetical protein